MRALVRAGEAGSIVLITGEAQSVRPDCLDAYLEELRARDVRVLAGDCIEILGEPVPLRCCPRRCGISTEPCWNDPASYCPTGYGTALMDSSALATAHRSADAPNCSSTFCNC